LYCWFGSGFRGENPGFATPQRGPSAARHANSDTTANPASQPARNYDVGGNAYSDTAANGCTNSHRPHNPSAGRAAAASSAEAKANPYATGRV